MTAIRAAAVSRSSSGCRRGAPARTGTARARIASMICVDLALGHAVCGLCAGPGRHRSLVGVDAPVGQQVQLRLNICRYSSFTRQAAPAALTEDTQHRFGVSALRIPPGLRIPVTCAPSPCGRLSRPPWPGVTPGRVGCTARSRIPYGCGPFPCSLPPNPACPLSGHRALQRFMARSGPLRLSALRIPHGPYPFIACAPSPCGPSLAVSRLAGRYPADYCGHSVAIGLASLRRSHVHTAVRIEHDLGVPSVSLNALTGHRSCTPEDCSGLVANPPQGPVPVSGVFPAGAALHLLETRLQAITLSPYRADLPARHPVRLGMSRRFPGTVVSRSAWSR